MATEIDVIEGLFGENPDEVRSWDGEGGTIDFPEPGDYEVSIVGAPVIGTSGAGNRTLCATMEVISNADGSESDQTGKTFKKWYVIEPGSKALGRTKCFLEAVGFELNRWSPSQLDGERLIVTITSRDYVKLDAMTGEEKTLPSIDVTKERAVEGKTKKAAPAKAAAKAPVKPANGKPAPQARR